MAWNQESIRHSLAKKGLTRQKTRTGEDIAKEMSETSELTWAAFQELYPDPETRLQQLFDDGRVDIDGEEADTTMRKRVNEARITYEEDGEEKELSVMPNTKITLLGETD